MSDENGNAPSRGWVTPFLRANWRTIYILVFFSALVTFIAALVGWRGIGLPFWLTLLSMFMAPVDMDNDDRARVGVHFGGLALLLSIFKIGFGWPWPVWILIAFPAFVGFASLATFLYDSVLRMFGRGSE